MTVTTPIGIQAAIDGTNLVQDVAFLPPRLALRAIWLWLASRLLADCPTDPITTVAAPTTTAVRIIGATGGELSDARQSAI